MLNIKEWREYFFGNIELKWYQSLFIQVAHIWKYIFSKEYRKWAKFCEKFLKLK